MRSLFASLCVVSVGLLAGCSSGRKAPYASDPVLLHYKPTLNDSATIMAEKQAHRGPTKPPMPPGSREPADDPTLAKNASADKNTQSAKVATPPGQLLAPPPGTGIELAKNSEPAATPEASSMPVRPPEPGALPVPAVQTRPEPIPVSIPDAVPVSVPQPVVDARSTTVDRRSVDGTYANDKDYRRVQGVLERHYRGWYSVRYCDPSEEDRYGGKFRLVDDQRINQFKEGDVIAVEGEMIPNGPESYNMNPRFRIHDIRMVRQK